MNKYQSYLQSETWRERRLAKLEAANFRCTRCGEEFQLSVHHHTYRNLGDEQTSELQVLCPSCHWIADEYRRGEREIYKKFYKPHKQKYHDRIKREQSRRSEIAKLKKEHKKIGRANRAGDAILAMQKAGEFWEGEISTQFQLPPTVIKQMVAQLKREGRVKKKFKTLWKWVTE